MSRGSAGFVRDNLEAFAVAIAMALVIRHYCIEAFRIPTGSMMPSLYGDDPATRRQGDRILVDKVAYLRRDPDRWEVVVFLFPLNKGKNFIKRLVGLPDEWLHIRDGDIWTSRDEGKTWTIARKPPGARDQLFFAYYPEPPERIDAFASGGNWEAAEDWTLDEAARRFVVDAGEESRTLRFARRVVPYGGVDDGRYATRPYCGDARVSFTLDVERPGDLSVVVQEHGRRHRLVLGADGSRAVVGALDDGDEIVHEVDVRLAAGAELDVSFANVDDTLVVTIDGDTFEFPFPPGELPLTFQLENDGHGHHEIALEARGLRATLGDVSIERDVYYNARKGDTADPWKIPAGHYFMLGDNTQSSRDSREWRVDQVTLQSGETIRWDRSNDGFSNPHAGNWEDDEVVVIAPDIDGLVRRFRGDEVVDWKTEVDWPFVPRGHLIGRAFCIFWPIYVPPLYTGPTRVNLIR